MKRFFVVAVAALAALALCSTPAFATSGTTIQWQGHGSENLPCAGNEHWVLSPAKGITSATLYIDGVPYAMSQNGNGSYSADTNVGFNGSQSVSVTYFGDNNTAFLKLSHCDSGQSTTGGTTTGGTTDGGTTDGGTTDGGTTDGGTTDGGTTDGGTTEVAHRRRHTGGGTTGGGTTGGGTTGGGTTGGGTGGGGLRQHDRRSGTRPASFRSRAFIWSRCCSRSSSSPAAGSCFAASTTMSPSTR